MSNISQRSVLSASIAAALFSLLQSPAALAAEDAPAASSGSSASTASQVLPKIEVSTQTGAYRKGEKDSASAAAPTQGSLDSTQPTSIITREFIENSVAPTAEYSRVVNIAPSMSGDSANGPGLSETKTSMRGFSDDQYNITFDGIPWGDTNNPAHHSTSFFPASTIGGAVVDRGPGTASNIGYATFGGTIALFSKKPNETSSASGFGSFGTWNTSLIGAAYESGRLKDAGDMTVQLNFQHLQSNGYLTLNDIRSDNFTVKITKPVGNTSVFTLFSSVNRIKYTQPDNNSGPTLAQVALFGKNFSLNNDPTSFNYSGFNHTAKDTDFEYLRLQTDWGDRWASEATAYSYYYNNQTLSSTDPTGLTAAGTKVGPVGNRDIPGIDKQNKYRVYGGIFKLTKEFDAGLFRVGAWYDKSDTDRHQYDIDLTLGNIRDPRETKPTPLQLPSVLFDQQSTIKTLQPFVEFEWEAAQDLTITPGVKAVKITRSVDAVINQTTRLPQNTGVDYKTTLPFLTVNQQFGDGFAVYAQYAKGFQIPDLKTFYIADPTHNSSEPQLSTNYQVGIVGKSRQIVWDLDVYQIDFKNKIVSNGLAGTAAAFVNLGGATYKGIEGQLTYMLVPSLALYVNGSTNKATANDTGKQISKAPVNTGAVGLIYTEGPWNSSFIYKHTGAVYMQDYTPGSTTYDYYRLKGYNNADFGLAYTFNNLDVAKKLKLQVNVFNLLNKQEVTSISTGKTLLGDQYTYQAPRSYQVSVRAEF